MCVRVSVSVSECACWRSSSPPAFFSRLLSHSLTLYHENSLSLSLSFEFLLRLYTLSHSLFCSLALFSPTLSPPVAAVLAACIGSPVVDPSALFVFVLFLFLLFLVVFGCSGALSCCFCFVFFVFCFFCFLSPLFFCFVFFAFPFRFPHALGFRPSFFFFFFFFFFWLLLSSLLSLFCSCRRR